MALPNTFEQMIESKYLKKEDVDPPRLLTIAGFRQENVAPKDEVPEIKWIMGFHEQGMKPLVMNSTNIQLLKIALGVNSPQEAIGRSIVAFNDQTVSFGGKLVGGVRLRAPTRNVPPADVDEVARLKAELARLQASGALPGGTLPPAPMTPAKPTVDKFDDDIPF